MTESNDIQLNNEIVIAVFEGEHTAEKVLTDIESLGTNVSASLKQEATVVTMNEDSKLSVTPPANKGKGAAAGAVVGALVGTVFGLPVVGWLYSFRLIDDRLLCFPALTAFY